MRDWIRVFDDTVYKFVTGFISIDMTRVMKFFTFLGSELTITFMAVILPFMIFIMKRRKYYRTALVMTANIALGAL